MYKEAILNNVSEIEIITHYFPAFKGKKEMFTNPLAAKDNTPSLQWYKDAKGAWKFKAHNTNEQGDIWQFVAYRYQLDCATDFSKVCTQVISDMRLNIQVNEAIQEKIFTPVFIDQYTESFLAFWSKFKVDRPTLERYNVRQVKSLRNGRYNYDYTAGIVSGFTVNSRYKIYIPVIPENEKWTKANGKVAKRLFKNQTNEDVFGLEQLTKGYPIFICEGEKDALVLAASGYNAISFQSATCRPTNAVIQLLKEQSNEVFICYDSDAPGRNGAAWLHSHSGFKVINLPEGIKDIADYFVTADKDAFDFLVRKAAEENKNAASTDKALEDQHSHALDQVRKLYHNPRHDREGKMIDITIRVSNFYELLISFGFKRYDVENGNILVKIESNIVEQVTPVHVQDYFFKWIEKLPALIDGNPIRDLLKEKFAKGRESFFSNGSLTMLRNDREFEFCTDTKDEAFIFFRNGFVKCTKENWTLNEYSTLDKYVWKNQILKRDFVHSEFPVLDIMQAGIFSQFINNICNNERDRFDSFCTIIGYLLHNYFEGKLKAIVFTDSSLQDGDNGRTGKTLVINALHEVKPTAILNGKSFDVNERFKYQDVELQTQIIALNDVKRNFPLEPLYNDITEKVFVERKNLKPFTVKSKFVIVSNRTIKTEGASARDRVLEFEFSGHYSDQRSPYDDFPGKWFFSKNDLQFNREDWVAFDNYMCYCLHLYLFAGLRQPSIINLHRRKLIDQTSEEFVAWMDDQVSNGNIVPGNRYDKAVLHTEFRNQHPDHKERGYFSQQRNFNTAVKYYIDLSGNFAPFNKQEDEQRSNGKTYIYFRSKTPI